MAFVDSAEERLERSRRAGKATRLKSAGVEGYFARAARRTELLEGVVEVLERVLDLVEMNGGGGVKRREVRVCLGVVDQEDLVRAKAELEGLMGEMRTAAGDTVRQVVGRK